MFYVINSSLANTLDPRPCKAATSEETSLVSLLFKKEHRRDAASAENSLTLLYGMQRDRNEELQSCREFSRTTPQERILRDRALYKVTSDFCQDLTKEEASGCKEDIVFNPNVFTEFKPAGSPEEIAADEENVRKVGQYLTDVALPKFVQDLCTLEVSPMDGQTSTEALAAHGINVRYIGKVAGETKHLPRLRDLCNNEIVVRSAKHVIKVLLLWLYLATLVVGDYAPSPQNPFVNFTHIPSPPPPHQQAPMKSPLPAPPPMNSPLPPPPPASSSFGGLGWAVLVIGVIAAFFVGYCCRIRHSGVEAAEEESIDENDLT